MTRKLTVSGPGSARRRFNVVKQKISSREEVVDGDVGDMMERPRRRE